MSIQGVNNLSEGFAITGNSEGGCHGVKPGLGNSRWSRSHLRFSSARCLSRNLSNVMGDGSSSVTNSTNSSKEKKKVGKRLKSMVPGGTKMDTVSTLDEAIHYAAATTTLPHHHLANSDLHISLKPTCFCSSATHARELSQ